MKKLLAIIALTGLALSGVHASQLVYWDFGGSGKIAAPNYSYQVGYASHFQVHDELFDSHDGFMLSRTDPSNPHSPVFTFSLTAAEDITLGRLDDYVIVGDHTASITLFWEYIIFDTNTLEFVTGLTQIGNPIEMQKDPNHATRLMHDEALYLGDISLAAGHSIQFRLSAKFGEMAAGYENITLGFVRDSGMSLYAIPEPSTWVLFGAGTAIVVIMRRRRKE